MRHARQHICIGVLVQLLGETKGKKLCIVLCMYLLGCFVGVFCICLYLRSSSVFLSQLCTAVMDRGKLGVILG